MVQKWSILWRTIVASALGHTLYPYVKHLRTLDLRDLGELLDDDKFRQGKISRHFFSAPLTQFHLFVNPEAKVGTRARPKRLDSQSIISAIGDAIVEQAPLLEGLTEPRMLDNLSQVLSTWAPRLTHLRRLDLWDGRALADAAIPNLLHVHCPNIDSLRMYHWAAADADAHLAAFIGGMQDNKLVEFENISNCHIGLETCLALNNHGESLKVLKLGLDEEGLLALGHLQDCTSLESLTIESLAPSPDLKDTQNDVYLEIIEWLKNCKKLREVGMTRLVSAPDLLLPILLDQEVVLEKLQINAKEGSMYAVKDHQGFHQALAQKTTLRQLLLCADPEAIGRDDVEVLMNTLCSLHELRTLHLYRVSDYLSDEHIKLLAQHLTNLEDLYIGGFGISDNVLPSVAGLKNVRNLTFAGLTSFTVDGILDFIGRLGESNNGLLLSVDMADMDKAIAPEGQDLIREAIASAIEGRFQYQLLRGKSKRAIEEGYC
jgi:hypothetical protein